MNGFTKLVLMGAMMPLVAFAAPSVPTPTAADPTKFDCRVTVHTHTVEGSAGRKIEVYRVMERL